MRRTHWLVATAIVIGGCGAGGGGPEVTAREIFRDSTAAALAEAAAEGDTARIRRLIAGGADPNARGRDGVTVSQWALLHQSPRGLAALLEGGADPALADSSGETVVHYAAKTNVPEYLEILLAHGADPDTRNGVTGATPLVPALTAQRENNFRLLMAAGADPNAADRMGDTPLHMAAKINAFARVLDLLEAGADPRATNKRGTTFQNYLDRTPTNLLHDEARRQREAIQSWLREHDSSGAR
jgi:ankyrin repeat protein